MSFELDNVQSLDANVRRIAREQLDKAEESLEHPDPHEAVHELRKRCKRIRALLRLVRPALGEVYDVENAYFRDLAKRFTRTRDAAAMVEAWDEALEHLGHPPIRDEAREAMRSALTARRDRLVDEPRIRRGLEEARRRLVRARQRVDDWQADDGGYDVVAEGLSKTYRRARKAMKKARKRPTSERFHELRKRSKYHRFHAQLLRGLWKDVAKAREDAADEMASLLGHDHDVALLLEIIRSGELEGIDDATLYEALLEHDSRRAREGALAIGDKLFAEPVEALVKRYGTFWEVEHAS